MQGASGLGSSVKLFVKGSVSASNTATVLGSLYFKDEQAAKQGKTA